MDTFSGTLYTNTGWPSPANGKMRERCFMEPENGERIFMGCV
jgi:hypothetical protein